MAALKVLVEGVAERVGQEMDEGFVLAVARGEVKAVEMAKIEDGTAGGPGRRRWSQLPECIWEFGFVLTEEGIGGIEYRIGSICVSCEERYGLGDAGLSKPRSGEREKVAGTAHYLRRAVKKGGRGRVFNAIMETPRL